MFRQEKIIKPINVIPKMAEWLLPETYLELGTESCRNIYEVEKLSSPDMLIGVDINIRRKLNPSKFKLYEMTTNDFFLKMMSKEIILPIFDLVFIDASHESSQVLKDFWNVLPFVSEQGMIIIHDTYPPSPKFLTKRFCFDSWKVPIKLKEYIKENKDCMFELCTFPGPPGYTIIRKNKNHLKFKIGK